jgi:hypothetical protein
MSWCNRHNYCTSWLGVVSDSARYGTLIIPSGSTLKIENAEVEFAAGGKIDIQPASDNLPAGQLIIVNSYLHGCDDQTWGGITLVGDENGTPGLQIDTSTITDVPVVIQARRSNNIRISNSYFTDGITAIDMDSCSSFTIKDNYFIGFVTDLKSHHGMGGTSTISGNYFADPIEAISISGNQSGLDIICNTFYKYSAYGVNSTSCTLKNQGSSSTGAGNRFYPNSLLLNNRFKHSGNSITYYTDPSHPFSLLGGIGFNALSVAAQSDGCASSSARLALNNNIDATNSIDEVSGITATIPNPATDETTIYFATGGNPGTLVLRNMFGEVLFSQKVNSDDSKATISCNNLQNGMYYVTLSVQGKMTSTKKLMIVK